LPTVPDAPTNPVVFERLDGALKIRWDKGESNGHNAISSYTIKVVETRQEYTLTPESDLDGFSQRIFTVKDLENGQFYTFEIASVNIAGSSAVSSASRLVGVEPEAPTRVRTERSDDATEVIVTWRGAGRSGMLSVTES
jgi:hypothetical protein